VSTPPPFCSPNQRGKKKNATAPKGPRRETDGAAAAGPHRPRRQASSKISPEPPHGQTCLSVQHPPKTSLEPPQGQTGRSGMHPRKNPRRQVSRGLPPQAAPAAPHEAAASQRPQQASRAAARINRSLPPPPHPPLTFPSNTSRAFSTPGLGQNPSALSRIGPRRKRPSKALLNMGPASWYSAPWRLM
jgi:hypothetical protein